MGFKVIFITLFALFLILPTVQSSSVNHLQIGLSGLLTTKDIIIENITESGDESTGEKSILIGTSNGMYIFSSNGNLEKYIQTSSSVTNILVLDDITGDKQKEILITTSDKYFPNVQVYDPKTGEKIWDFSASMEVYDMNMLWTRQQTIPFDVELVQDVNNNDYRDIAVTSGYNLFLIDGKTGKMLWEFKGNDNLWDVAILDDLDNDNIQDISVGSQDGYLYIISGKSGKLIWSRKISEKYNVINPSTNTSIGFVDRSVWDIVPIKINDKEKIAVSTEDGFVQLIDLESKETQWKKRVIEYVDMYLFDYYGDFLVPTSYIDQNFFNIRLKDVKDTNGDGNRDIVVMVFPGLRLTGKQYKEKTQKIYLLNSVNGDTIWENRNINLERAKRPEIIDIKETVGLKRKTCLLIPLGKQRNKERIILLNIEKGSEQSFVDVNSTTESFRINKYLVKELSENRFIMVSDYGDLMLIDISGKVIWNYPRIKNLIIKESDLTGDNTLDLLVKSKDNFDSSNFLDEGGSRMLLVIDGSTKNITWSFELPYETFMETGGLKEVQIVPDLNKDGKSDIIAYIQKPGDRDYGDEFGVSSRILIFSGKNGNILMNQSVTNKTYYGKWDEFYQDLPTSVKMKILSEWGITEEVLDKLSPEDKQGFQEELKMRYSEYLERERDLRIRKRIYAIDVINDKNGDGVPELLVSLWDDLFIIDPVSGSIIWNRTSDNWRYEDPYTGERPENIDWKRKNWTKHDRNRFKSLGDLNGDGQDDLVLIDWDGMTILLSNVTGSELDYYVAKRVTTERGIDKEHTKIIDDVNGDGYKDILTQIWAEDGPSKYVVISGKTGVTILEAEREGETNLLPSIADLDGDGSKDSIVYYRSGGRPIVKVIGNKGVIWVYRDLEDTWALESAFGYYSFMPAYPIDDIDGDGIPDLVLVRSLSWQPGAEVLVYNVKNNTLIKSITLEAIDKMRNQPKRWAPAVSVRSISDINNDGVKEIGCITMFGEGNKKEMKFVVLDVLNGKIISDFKIIGNDIIKAGDSVGIVGQNQGIYFLEIGNDLSIIKPKVGETLHAPIDLEWKRNETEFTNVIMMDNKKVLRTDDTKVSLDLLKGNHTITVYSFDPYGKGVYGTVTVNIVKESKEFAIALVIVIILLMLIFTPHMLEIKKKKISRGELI